ncbi:MAG TPA: hypothetical protein VGK21_04610 [Candidatus Angelobacter sp.]
MPVDRSQEQIIFEFQKAKGPAYILLVSEKNKTEKLTYLVHLLSIGKSRFLDVVPAVVETSTLDSPLKVARSKAGKLLEPRLIHLGLGAYLEAPGASQTEAYVRGAHWFFRFRFDGKKFGLDGTDDEKFLAAMETNRFQVETAGFEKSKDLLITASTKDLQKFVIEHVDDDSFFTRHIPEMERMLK